MSKRAILAPLNITVDEHNNKVLDMLPNENNSEKIYTSYDTADSDGNQMDKRLFSTEYLGSLTPTNFPIHKLRLRKYAIVMLIRNLSLKQGLCNGTRMMVFIILFLSFYFP